MAALAIVINVVIVVVVKVCEIFLSGRFFLLLVVDDREKAFCDLSF